MTQSMARGIDDVEGAVTEKVHPFERPDIDRGPRFEG